MAVAINQSKEFNPGVPASTPPTLSSKYFLDKGVAQQSTDQYSNSGEDMSLIASAERESRCDFPGCKEHFDSTAGAKCAKKKDGEVLAFCKAHSIRLANEGVSLYTLREVHETDRKEEEKRLEEERRRTEQERQFINSLK